MKLLVFILVKSLRRRLGSINSAWDTFKVMDSGLFWWMCTINSSHGAGLGQINSLSGWDVCITLKGHQEAKQIPTFTPVSSIWGSRAPSLRQHQYRNGSFLGRHDCLYLILPANFGSLWTLLKVFPFKMIHTASTINHNQSSILSHSHFTFQCGPGVSLFFALPFTG